MIFNIKALKPLIDSLENEELSVLKMEYSNGLIITPYGQFVGFYGTKRTLNYDNVAMIKANFLRIYEDKKFMLLKLQQRAAQVQQLLKLENWYIQNEALNKSSQLNEQNNTSGTSNKSTNLNTNISGTGTQNADLGKVNVKSVEAQLVDTLSQNYSNTLFSQENKNNLSTKNALVVNGVTLNISKNNAQNILQLLNVDVPKILKDFIYSFNSMFNSTILFDELEFASENQKYFEKYFAELIEASYNSFDLAKVLKKEIVNDVTLLNNTLKDSVSKIVEGIRTEFNAWKLLRGEKGERGETGLKGDKGDRGERGEKGDRGETGAQGIQGERGAQGLQGIQGERGLQGERGATGERGAQGERGATGAQGNRGETGATGQPGRDGTPAISTRPIFYEPNREKFSGEFDEDGRKIYYQMKKGNVTLNHDEWLIGNVDNIISISGYIVRHVNSNTTQYHPITNINGDKTGAYSPLYFNNNVIHFWMDNNDVNQTYSGQPYKVIVKYVKQNDPVFNEEQRKVEWQIPVKGVKGDPGERGAKGDKGDRGEKGDKGDRGEQGAPGIQGVASKLLPKFNNPRWIKFYSTGNYLIRQIANTNKLSMSKMSRLKPGILVGKICLFMYIKLDLNNNINEGTYPTNNLKNIIKQSILYYYVSHIDYVTHENGTTVDQSAYTITLGGNIKINNNGYLYAEGGNWDVSEMVYVIPLSENDYIVRGNNIE